MQFDKSTIIFSALILLPLIVFLRCSDPAYPGDSLVAAYPLHGGANHIELNDTLTVAIVLVSVESIDSIKARFGTGTDSIIWRNDHSSKLPFDSIMVRYPCTAIGKSLFSFTAYVTDGTTYQDSLSIDVSGIPAKVALFPVKAVVNERSLFSLTATASGSDSIRFSWLKNDTLLSNRSGSTLLFDSIGIQDAGIYKCIVDNGWATPDTSESTFVVVVASKSGIIDAQENAEVGAVIVVHCPADDSTPLASTNIDILKNLGDSVAVRRIGDSTVFSVTPAWKPGHAARVLRLDAVLGDTSVSDTAHFRFNVTDSNMAPRWKSDTLVDTFSVNTAEALTIPLAALLDEPDGDPVELRLLGGPPARDTIAADGTTYFLKSIYAAPGKYAVQIAARDNYGAEDTLTIDLSVLETK